MLDDFKPMRLNERFRVKEPLQPLPGVLARPAITITPTRIIAFDYDLWQTSSFIEFNKEKGIWYVGKSGEIKNEEDILKVYRDRNEKIINQPDWHNSQPPQPNKHTDFCFSSKRSPIEDYLLCDLSDPLELKKSWDCLKVLVFSKKLKLQSVLEEKEDKFSGLNNLFGALPKDTYCRALLVGALAILKLA